MAVTPPMATWYALRSVARFTHLDRGLSSYRVYKIKKYIRGSAIYFLAGIFLIPMPRPYFLAGIFINLHLCEKWTYLFWRGFGRLFVKTCLTWKISGWNSEMSNWQGYDKSRRIGQGTWKPCICRDREISSGPRPQQICLPRIYFKKLEFHGTQRICLPRK